MYNLYYTSQAQKDSARISQAGLRKKTIKLLEMIQADPYRFPPRYEMLKGDLKGAVSRRINLQHRLVYQVLEEDKAIKVLRMWTHYGE
ncbi:MAG: Txe/YoeB family addiction module toxin [Candidatus Margulisiibacteriota bacterium]